MRGGGISGFIGGRLAARELVNGGAYGTELVNEMVWNRAGSGRRGFWGFEGGRKVVKGEDVSSYHCY